MTVKITLQFPTFAPMKGNQKVNWFRENEVGEIPSEFTYPFHYEPHPLAVLASKSLQSFLLEQNWDHNFGFETDREGKPTGKMFGVLIVEKEGQIGHLWGFSGRLAGSSVHPRFVPPVFNILEENSFYRKGEEHLYTLNNRVEELENTEEYLQAKSALKNALNEFESALGDKKADLKIRKKIRHELRIDANDQTREELSKQSMKDHFELKEFKENWQSKIDELSTHLNKFEQEINGAKNTRKKYSGNLQQQIFTAFSFLNSKGETKDLNDIFNSIDTPIPSGAGECTAPKLLHYAYNNGFTPLAMAEFWWGSPPQTVIRKHGHYYPACKSKCKPILEHMLEGLKVANNPLEEDHGDHFLEVIYEDNDIIAVNKPAGLLSVPGKTKRASVESIIKSQVLDLEGPVIVHRLDMSTSGIMLLAKNTKAYHTLQQQFADKTIQKKYTAILEGVIDKKEGIISLPLRVDLDNRPQQMVCHEHGKKAVTKFEFLERKGKRSKVAFYPITGRTHQLRVHASHPSGLNTPIVGDDLYGTHDKRLFLHAAEIRFTHPSTGEEMKLTAKEAF